VSASRRGTVAERLVPVQADVANRLAIALSLTYSISYAIEVVGVEDQLPLRQKLFSCV
jgi:hypothetical protein